jgi:radical SAM protein with 4Fe4S-binding SPASM domain
VKALEVDYGEWSAALHRRARTGRLPINGSIEVTHRCPLACVHCYNNLPVGDQEARRRELDTDEMRRVIDEIADAGGLWLLFTGGEIFARRDFLDIYKHAKQRGFLVTLFTNGTQITPAIADTLTEWPPFSIEITIYGRTRETYEGLTGVLGSFDRCMRGIQLLRERRLPLKLKTVAVSINRHEVGDMQQFAEELGVEFKFDGMINARIDCSHSPLEVRLSPLEMVELDVGDPGREAAWGGLIQTRPVGLPTASDQVYHCGGGVSSFAIDPEGKMSICVLSHQDTFDLRTGSFQDGWNRFLGEVRAKKATRRTKCTDCRIRQLCSTCAATAELEHGDAEAPVEYFCEVAHLRAHALGHVPPAHGTCDFCEGGRYHARVLADAATIKSGVPSRPRRRASLSVVSDDRRAAGTSCGSGGCESCGSPPMQGEQ